MKAAQEKRQKVLGQLIGNLFEPASHLVKAGNGYRAGELEVSAQHVGSLRKYGYLNDLAPTEKALLWYQDSLSAEP